MNETYSVTISKMSHGKRTKVTLADRTPEQVEMIRRTAREQAEFGDVVTISVK